MNKTTEALKLAEEALDELRYANDTDIAKTKYYKALAAIREAQAEQELYEPEGRCKECSAYNGHLDYCSKAAPVSVEAIRAEPANTRSTSEYSEPVKQEPVGVVESSEEWGVAGVLIAGLPIGTKLYAAPVSAEAIRAEALEEAAKIVDHVVKSGGSTYGDVIRNLKGNNNV